MNIEKFTSYLQGITRNTSTQKCARSIRVGLQSSGAKIVNHPVAAADWGSTLMQLGYKKINASFDRPKKGDIYIIDRTQGHKYGHIAAYSGSAWVSDFKQRDHAVYRNKNVTYSYYRLETYF
ncbi:CHAP domain-containing protein [Salmonella enterica]|nr:CHAP domain-containing protein [Salmonella enterica]